MKTSSSTIIDDLIKKHNLQRSSLDCEVARDQMLEVSELLHDWREFARAAGLTEANIFTIERDEFKESGRRYKALYMWYQKNASCATHIKLLGILSRIGKADIVEKVCVLLKKDGSTSATGKIM